ncbi:endonuclease/exonuclease/phosphatase family protein [Vitreimonas flagellata]|uniref:endonuclease/exonuclease/phosphatase family protein n=1 Tax=Vitreimonas flagellata TaxID=2560861 RepID=UPI001074F427|nr:endonuclease/exonuclease/phosphatase family protein [Vitreimonas flagellata]
MIGSIIAVVRTNGPAVLGRATLLLALAAWGGAISPFLDGLNHFAPIWLAVSLAGVLACWLAGSRGWAVYCAIATLAQAVIIAPEFMRTNAPLAATPTAERTVRIVWLNTWLGSRPSEDVLHYLETSEADFLLVSEMHDEGQASFRRLRATYPTVIRCEDGRACNTIIFAKREALSVQTQTGLRATAGDFDIDGAQLRLIAAHVARPNPPGRQQRELDALLDVIGSDQASVILAGDFNSTPWSFTLRRFDGASELQRHTRALPTWPAQEWTRLRLPALTPFLPIDHVYSGAHWRLVSVRRGPRTSSDHFPLEATFQSRRSEQTSAVGNRRERAE